MAWMTHAAARPNRRLGSAIARAAASWQAVLLCALACSSSAAAQVMADATKPDYERVVHDALQEYHLTNFAEAYALFEQAHQLRPSARTWRCLGMTSFELRQYVRSEAELRAALNDVREPLTAEQHAEVVTLLDRVAHYIGTVALRIKPSSASVVIDGQVLAEPAAAVAAQSVIRQLTVNLGEHDLVVREDGYQTVVRKLLVEGGKVQSLDIELTPVQSELAPPPSEVARRAAAPLPPTAAPNLSASPKDSEPLLVERWWFWTAVGVVVVGSVAAVVALSASPDKPKPEPGDVTIVTLTKSASGHVVLGTLP
jgi:hypothetical protein